MFIKGQLYLYFSVSNVHTLNLTGKEQGFVGGGQWAVFSPANNGRIFLQITFLSEVLYN